MKNKILIMAVSVLGLSGCANFGVPDETGFLMQKEIVSGKTFALTHLDDKALDDTMNSTMNFDSENVISGRGFCNLYRGTYSISYNNLLEVENTAFTSKSCKDINLNTEKKVADIMSEPITVSKSTLGYKMSSSKGSFNLMEIKVVDKK